MKNSTIYGHWLLAGLALVGIATCVLLWIRRPAPEPDREKDIKEVASVGRHSTKKPIPSTSHVPEFLTPRSGAQSVSAASTSSNDWQACLASGTRESAAAAAQLLLESRLLASGAVKDALGRALDCGVGDAFARTLLMTSRRDVLQGLTMFLDAERDPGRRASVSQYLQAVHGSAANDVLLDGLKRFASDSNVAPHYRDAIARNMDAGGAAIIAERFHDDATPFEERSYLLGAIARVNSESSVPVLATMLTDERLNGSQVHVMAALASIGSCSSVDTLVRYAETIPADTANPVFNVLASLKVKGDAHASLARHFTTTTHPETKRAIAQALSSAGESAGQ